MSIPLSIWVGITIGSSVPAAFFFIEYSIERSLQKVSAAQGTKSWITLTPRRQIRDYATGDLVATNDEVDFDPRHNHYMKSAEVLITLASASLIFIPGLHFTSVFSWIGLPMVLLGFTVVYALWFMGIVTYFYEMFLFDQNSFTALRSSLMFSLGFGALFCFAVAYSAVAIIIGVALSRGLLVFNH